MADKKVIFIAFAIEDERARDFLKGQSLHTKTPFEFVDMSVKEPYNEEWKKRVRTRILKSDGVLAVVSKNSLSSSGQKWEITCAKDEKKKLRGIWAYKEDRTALQGVNTMVWTWDNSGGIWKSHRSLARACTSDIGRLSKRPRGSSACRKRKW